MGRSPDAGTRKRSGGQSATICLFSDTRVYPVDRQAGKPYISGRLAKQDASRYGRQDGRVGPRVYPVDKPASTGYIGGQVNGTDSVPV